MANAQKISPFLFFKDQAEQAANFYVSVFGAAAKDARVTYVSRYGDVGPGEKGKVMMVELQLAGQTFYTLNGAPPSTGFNESMSLFVMCEDQKEIDHFWNAFVNGGGEEIACGWCKDRFGVRWQVVPRRHMELMKSPDAAVSQRVMAAMMKMKKFDLAQIEKAAAAQ